MDGAVSPDGRVWGTYLHGLFENPGLRRSLLAPLYARRGLRAPRPGADQSLEGELDRLADHLERHLDMPAIFRMLDPALREADRWIG